MKQDLMEWQWHQLDQGFSKECFGTFVFPTHRIINTFSSKADEYCTEIFKNVLLAAQIHVYNCTDLFTTAILCITARYKSP